MKKKKLFIKSKDFCKNIYKLAKNKCKKILLPEGHEPRIIKAASICQKLNLANCVLFGKKKKIIYIAKLHNIDLHKKILILNPKLIYHKYINKLIKLKKFNDINKCLVYKYIFNKMVLASVMLYNNDVDGIVSGAIHTTAETLRPVFSLIGKKNNSLISSVFFILLKKKVLVYADCAININPNSEELANIAIQSAYTAKSLGIIPRIAMLSYSSGFSSSGDSVEKVRIATQIVKKKYPNLIIDGPLQYDSAVNSEICKLKLPNSCILGNASVIIFPDLNSGNITYKAVQWTSIESSNNPIIAIGPILQGIKKPVNDLSRGSLVQDIVYTIAITSIQVDL